MTTRKPTSCLISMDEFKAMDDTEFFNYLEKEIGSDFFSPSSSKTKETSETLEEFRTSLSIPKHCLDFDDTDQLPDLASSPEDHSPTLHLPGLPNSTHFNYLPEDDHEAKPPKFRDIITLIPETSVYTQTLSDSCNEGISPFLSHEHKYTIYRVVDKVPSVESKQTCFEERHLGASFNPSRRVDVYKAFVRQLTHADLPFSYEQRETIVELEKQVELLLRLSSHGCESIFTNFRDQELKFKADLDLLFESLADMDFLPKSMILVNHNVAAMISKLEFWVERDPMIPIVIPGKIPFFVDPASYLISKLRDVFPDTTKKRIDTALFTKRKDLHVKLTRIFAFTKYPFTSTQKAKISELLRIVESTTGEPGSQEENAFLDVMNKLTHDLNYKDQGTRVGLSNPKKIRKAHNKLISDLVDLGYEERKTLGKLEDCHYFLIYDVIWELSKSFIPKNVRLREQISTLSLWRDRNES